MERLALLGTVGTVVFAVVAIAMMASGRYLLAGTSFLLLSFSIYLRETRQTGSGG